MKKTIIAILFSLFTANANAGLLTVAGSTVGAYVGASEGSKKQNPTTNTVVLKSDKKNVHVVMCSVYGGGLCEGSKTPAQFAKSIGYDYIHSVTTVIVPRGDNHPAEYYAIEVSN